MTAPDHWIETTLGEIAEIVSGGTPKTSEDNYWGGDIVWVTPTEVVKAKGVIINDSERKITTKGLANSSAKMLPQGAILLTSRATIGATALAGVPMSTNQGFASLIAGEDALPEFLMYWCQANTVEFTSRAGGSTFKEISRKKIATIPITLPPPPRTAPDSRFTEFCRLIHQCPKNPSRHNPRHPHFAATRTPQHPTAANYG